MALSTTNKVIGVIPGRSIKVGDLIRLQVACFPGPAYDFCHTVAIQENPHDVNLMVIWYKLANGQLCEDIIGKDETFNIMHQNSPLTA